MDIEHLNYEDLSDLEKNMLKFAKVCEDVNISIEEIGYNIHQLKREFQYLEKRTGGRHGEEKN